MTISPSLPTSGFSFLSWKRSGLLLLSDAKIFAALTDEHKPFVWERGDIRLKILNFIQNRGLFYPEPTSLKRVFKQIGYDIDHELELLRLQDELPRASFRIAKIAFHHIMLHLNDKVMDIASTNPLIIQVEKSPKIPLSLTASRLDPFFDNLKESFHAQKRAFLGRLVSCIDESFIETIMATYRAHHACFLEAIASENKISFLKFKQLPSFVIDKSHEALEIYACMKKPFYEGFCKTLYVALKLAPFLVPCALTIQDRLEQEITLRKVPELKKAFSHLYTFWDNPQGHLFTVTELASAGNLYDVIQKPLTITQKDQIATSVLDLVTKLHRHAIHKQLSLDNIILDETTDGFIPFFSDLFYVTLQSDTASLKTLLPSVLIHGLELIDKVHRSADFTLSGTFTSEIDSEMWILSNRYSLGLLLAHIYLGYHPYRVLQNKEEVSARFPLAEKKLEEVLASKQLWAHLIHFIELSSSHEAFITLLKEPFFRVYTERHPFTLREGLTEFEKGLNEYLYKKKRMYEYQRAMKLPDVIFELQSHLTVSEKEKLLEILGLNYNVMLDEAYAKLDEDLFIKIKALSTNILEKIESDDEEIQKRLALIQPLLDLDPEKRPSPTKVKMSLFGI